MSISNIEIGTFLNFFNRSGYVLDFSTVDFDTFTHESIGVPLCETYKMSKGKSLVAYVKQASPQNIIKLFNDLMTHYELSSLKEFDEENQKAYATAYLKCRSILDRINSNTIADVGTVKLKEVFNSDYISSQIDLMVKMQDENPTEAIGKAKELIESCCKTILEKEGHIIEKDWDMTRLVDETFKLFGIMPKQISDDIKGAKSIKQVLGNLKATAQGISELRNLYGSGHGKSSSFTGLEPRHASLAVGSSVTLVRFLWDSYERYKHISNKG